MTQAIIVSQRRAGKLAPEVERIKKVLAENPGQTMTVVCKNAKQTRRMYKGWGLDMGRLEFDEAPAPGLASRSRPGDWIRRLKERRAMAAEAAQ